MDDKMKIEALPFDQFQRYTDINRLIELLPGAAKGSLLDIGGHPGLITEFVKGPKITITDLKKVNKDNFVKADATKLPFKTSSFLTAVSLDVLEHIPADKREKVLSEVTRVAKENIILTAPFHNEATILAEEIVHEFHVRTMKKDLPVLKEHLVNGLPDINDTVKYFEDKGYSVATFPSGYLYSWLPMQMSKIYIQSLPGSKKLEKSFDNFYNLYYYSQDHREPSYRTVIVASKNKKANVKKIADSFIKEGAKNSKAGPDMTMVMLSMFDLKHKNEISALKQELEDTKVHLKERLNHIKNLEEANKEMRQWIDKAQKGLPYKFLSKVKNAAGSKKK
jgi:SAM-dependent methyltransferase